MSLKQTCPLVALFLLLGLASCATYRGGIIEIRPVNEYAHLSTTEGISVAADPYDSTEKVKQGFCMDVTRKGFFPVNLLLKNDTNERIQVLKESIELIDENGMIHKPVTSKVMFERFKKNAVARFLAGCVISVSVGVVSYTSTLLANRKMKADWQQKEIPNQLVLEPRGQLNGFVYFKVPEDKATRVSKLCLESERPYSGKTVQLEFDLSENESSIVIYPTKRKKNLPLSTFHSGR